MVSNIYNIIVWHLEEGSMVTILQVVLKCKLSWWVTCVYTWNFGKSHLKRVSNCSISSCPVSTVLSAVFNNIFSILCAKGENADRAADTFLQCVSGAWLVFSFLKLERLRKHYLERSHILDSVFLCSIPMMRNRSDLWRQICGSLCRAGVSASYRLSCFYHLYYQKKDITSQQLIRPPRWGHQESPRYVSAL